MDEEEKGKLYIEVVTSLRRTRSRVAKKLIDRQLASRIRSLIGRGYEVTNLSWQVVKGLDADVDKSAAVIVEVNDEPQGVPIEERKDNVEERQNNGFEDSFFDDNVRVLSDTGTTSAVNTDPQSAHNSATPSASNSDNDDMAHML